jgi:hypothetical protein
MLNTHLRHTITHGNDYDIYFLEARRAYPDFLGVKIALSRTEVDHVGTFVFFMVPAVYVQCF